MDEVGALEAPLLAGWHKVWRIQSPSWGGLWKAITRLEFQSHLGPAHLRHTVGKNTTGSLC